MTADRNPYPGAILGDDGVYRATVFVDGQQAVVVVGFRGDPPRLEDDGTVEIDVDDLIEPDDLEPDVEVQVEIEADDPSGAAGIAVGRTKTPVMDGEQQLILLRIEQAVAGARKR